MTPIGRLVTTTAVRNTGYKAAVNARAHRPSTSRETPRNSTGRRPILEQRAKLGIINPAR
jgi:hypothetical protein